MFGWYWAFRLWDSRDVHVVYIAPALVLPASNLLDDGVVSFVKVPPGVFPGRGVTAADVPAAKAQAQAHPPTTGFQTLFAAFCVRCHIPNLIKVLTFCHFVVLPIELQIGQIIIERHAIFHFLYATR
jgi:hypothetical protein